MNFEGLEKSQDPQRPIKTDADFSGLEPWQPPPPGWHPGRMVGGAWEGFKDWARRKATFVRTQLEHAEPDEAWQSQMDELNPHWRDWLMVENPELAGEVQALIDDGAEPEIAKQIITGDFLDKRQKDQLDFVRSIEESQYLETSPEFMGQSSGTAENVSRVLTASAGDVLGLMVSPWIGIPMMYTGIHGALTQQMEEQAEAAGLEIDKERLYKGATIGAITSLPLELIGNLFKIRAITGSGPWTARLMHIGTAFMGEAATEFLQTYPETVSVAWALNPDLTGDELLDHIQDLILSSKTAREALYSGWVGGWAGAATGAIGQSVVGLGSQLVHPKQRRIYEDKANRIKEYMRNDDLDPEQQKEFLRLVGMDPDAPAEDQEIADIVERVKARLLFQAAPIESEARNQLIHQLEGGKMPQDIRELYLSIWDGMARVAAEEGLIGKPEDFYEQWIAEVRLSKEAEIAEKAGREKVPPFMYQYKYSAEDLELKPEETKHLKKIANKDIETGEVYAYEIGEDDIFNHADIAIRHNMDFENVETGFIDDQGQFTEGYRDRPLYQAPAYQQDIDIFEKAIFNPIDRTASQKEKAKQLKKLSDENAPIVNQALERIDKKLGTRSKSSHKTPENIVLKANRPDIKKRRPWFDVEHVRDSFRFKTVISDINDIGAAIQEILNIPGVRIVKADFEKMTKPKDWGWRFVAFDLQMPNGQIVEYYLPLKELEAAKKAGNHKLFEKWRNLNEEERIKRFGEYEADIKESRKGYDNAWNQSLARLGLDSSAAAASFENLATSLGSVIGTKLSFKSSAEKVPTDQVPFTRMRGTGKDLESRTMRRPSDLSKEITGIIRTSKEYITPKGAYVKQDRRGAVQYLFDETPKIIHLFESADVSTALHETGHILIEMMYRAGSLDYLAAAEWVGVEEDRARQGTDKWTDAEQEKFAKAFELYLLEGRAPTTRLQIVFEKLKSMLLAIYKSLANRYFSDVDLNEDMRRLFDRWIATEQERLGDPVIDVSEWLKSDDMQMAESDLAELEKQRRALNPGSVAEMEYDDLIATARRAVGAELASRRAKREKELEREFKKEAEASIEGDPFYIMLDEILESGGLRRDSVQGLYSSEWVREIQRRRPDVVSGKEDAIEPDVIAMQHGYETADEMLQDILYRPGKKQAIEEYFDSLWREYEATEHLNNANAYAEILETEVEILNQMMGRKRPKVRRDLKKTIRAETGQIRTPDSRKLAEDLKRDQQVARQAWAAAKKAARDEFNKKLSTEKRDAARKEKDKALDKIAKLRENHLVKMKALRDHYKRNREKEKVHKRMGRYIRHKSMLPEFKAHILNVLGRYYKIPKTFKTDPPSETLEQFVEGLEAEGEQLDIIRMLLTKLPAPKTKGRLTAEDVQNIGDLVDALAHIERMQRKQKMIDEKKAFQEVVDEAVDEIYKEHKPGSAQEGPLVDERISFLQEMSESAKAYFAQLKKAEFIIRALDGWKDLGVNWRTVFQPIKKAEDAELTLVEEYTQKLKEAFKGFDRKWANKLYKIEGIADPISKENMIMLMLNSGNKGNREAVKVGNGFTQEALDEIAGKLTGAEIDLVYRIWKLIDSLFPKLNEVHKKLTGVNLRKVEGKYFPLIFSRKLSWKAGEFQAQREMRDMFASAYVRPKVEAGHRVERKGGKMPVDLRLDVIASHIQKVTHDITHQVPVRNVQRVLFEPKYRNAVVAALGEDAYKQLTPWLQEVARPRRDPMSILEKWVGRIRRNATIVALGLKLTVAQKQTLSLTQTMDELGALETLRAMKQFYRDPWKLRRFVNERSPSIKNRRKAWDRELNQFYGNFNPREWKGTTGMREAFFSLISLMDAIATYPTWLAGYNVGMKRFDGNEKKAIEYADMVVRRTQPVARAKDLADIQRGGELKKTLTMFYTFFNVFQNRMMELHGRRRSGRVNMTELLKSYWLLLVVPGILGTLVNKREWDNEDIIKGIVSYSLAGMPGFRDLAQGVLSDYGYSMTPVAQFGQEVAYVGKSLEAGKFEKLPKHLIYVSGYTVGLPAAQINIALDGLVDMAEGKTSNPMRLLLREKKDKD